MTKNETAVIDAAIVCNNCGAEQVSQKPQCWLCGILMAEPPVIPIAKPYEAPPKFVNEESKTLWLLTLPVSIFAAIIICIGCWQHDPFLGLVITGLSACVLGALVLIIPFVAFRGPTQSSAQTAAKVTFLVMGAVFGAALLVVAAVILLFAACIGLIMHG